MATITSTSSNPLDAVQGTMWVIFNVDSDFTGSNINQITVTGDGRRSAVLHLNKALWLRVTNIPPSGSFTVTFATGALTPALDAEQSFKFTWTSRDNIWTVTELTGIPTLTISPTSNSMETGATQTITVSSSAALTTFDASKVTLSAGTISGFTGSGTSYTFTLTAPASGSGTIHIDIPATSEWQAAPRASVTYAPPQPPQTPATVTLSRSATAIQTGQTATITATFNKTVTGIAANDFSADRGTLSGWTRVSATVYRIVWTAPSSGTATATITLRANAATEGNAAATITVAYAPPRQQPPASTLSIEAIDEQTIPILTEDYVLEIDIGGDPTRAYVDGDMEGFYHEWDATNAKIRIKAIKVTRLISGAIWNVHLVKGTETLDRQIIYNVIPSAPVITNPGPQTLYKGFNRKIITQVANVPSVLRGSGLLTGLKYIPAIDAEGEPIIMTEGVLPKRTKLSEASFMMKQYAENDGGTDELDVPVTIKAATFLATIEFRYRLPNHIYTLRVYDLRDANKQFGEDISLPTFFQILAMSDEYIAVGNERGGRVDVKVFDFINGGQVGPDLDVGFIRGYSSHLAMSRQYLVASSSIQLKVYDLENENVQVGDTLDRPSTYRSFSKIAVSGTRFAVLIRNRNHVGGGIIKVYDISSSGLQQVGSDITLESTNRASWVAIAMSGSRVAVLRDRSTYVQNRPIPADRQLRFVRVYDTANNNAQVGSDISLGDSGGWSEIAMSGSRVAVLGGDSGSYYIKVFDIDNSGQQVGNDINLGRDRATRLNMLDSLVAVTQSRKCKVFDIDNSGQQVGSDIGTDSPGEFTMEGEWG